MSTPDLAEIEAISLRHRKLGEVIADLTAQQKDLEDRFEALVPVGFETVVDGEPVFRRPPNRSFSLTRGVEIVRSLGITLTPKWEYSADEVKGVLKEADRLDEAMLPGTGKTRVKL